MIPKSKHSEIIEKLNSFNKKIPTEFELARLRSDIASYQKTSDYATGKELSGMYSAIAGDIASLRKNYEAALKHSGESPKILLSYTISLDVVHQYQDSIRIAKKVFSHYPDDIEVLELLFSIFVNASDIPDAKLVLDRIRRLGAIKDNNKIKDQIVVMEERESFFEDNNLLWEDLSARTSLAAETLLSKGVKVFNTRGSYDDELLSLEFLVKVQSDKELSEAELLISDALTNVPYSPIDNHIAFFCTNDFDPTNLTKVA